MDLRKIEKEILEKVGRKYCVEIQENGIVAIPCGRKQYDHNFFVRGYLPSDCYAVSHAGKEWLLVYEILKSYN